MIIDDNEMMREFLIVYFKKEFEVVAMQGALDAVNTLEQIKPEVIVLDLNMPGMSGEEFLTYLKENQQTQSKVIVLSSVEKSLTRINCLEKGAADYLTKPFNPKELELRITQQLNISLT